MDILESYFVNTKPTAFLEIPSWDIWTTNPLISNRKTVLLVDTSIVKSCRSVTAALKISQAINNVHKSWTVLNMLSERYALTVKSDLLQFGKALSLINGKTQLRGIYKMMWCSCGTEQL